MTRTNFGARLKLARNHLALTQAELALELNVTIQTISNWEVGRCVPWSHTQAGVLARITELYSPVKHRDRVLDRI